MIFASLNINSNDRNGNALDFLLCFVYMIQKSIYGNWKWIDFLQQSDRSNPYENRSNWLQKELISFFFSFVVEKQTHREKKRICLIQSIEQSHYYRRRRNVAFNCKIFTIFVVRRLIKKCISGRQPWLRLS